MLALALVALPPMPFAERWAYAMPSRGTIPNTGALEIAGERAFYLETSVLDDGGVGCLDLRTGRLLWHIKKGAQGAGRLLLEGGHLILKRNDAIVEIDPASGKARWTLNVEPYHMGPFEVGSTLVAEVKAGALRAFDLRTHRPLWSLDYPKEFRGYTRNGAAAVGGGALWAEAADGQVFKIAMADGRLLFKRPSGVKEPYAIVPMGGRVAVLGGEGMAVWRSADGGTVWALRDGMEGGAYYATARDELWRFGWGEGQLVRYQAKDGVRVGPPVELGGPYGSLGLPRPWGKGYLMATNAGLLRLDATGHPVGEYQAGENFTEALPLGLDVLTRSDDRVVRLRPGRPPAPKDPVTEARRLVAKRHWSTTERIALERLGRVAVPTILAALEQPECQNPGPLESVLLEVADARYTDRIFPLAEAAKTFTGESTFENRDYRGWMETKADPEWLAPRLLPRLRKATDDNLQVRLVEMLKRSRNPAVVGEFLRRLRSFETKAWVKGEIYRNLSSSGRPEALAYVLRTRAEGRRLAKATAGLSTTQDTDGDGIPDAYDANPYVAPRPLGEKERIMAAAFDASFRFEGRAGEVTSVAYGPGMRPFELVGWSGALRPVFPDVRMRVGPSERGLSFETFSVNGEVVRMSKDGQEATVRLARVMGYGTEERLRKIAGEWFVVSFRVTWQN